MSTPWSGTGPPDEQGPAYAGPPPTAPPPYGYGGGAPYGPGGYGPGGYGQGPYGQGPYGQNPHGPGPYGPPPYGYGPPPPYGPGPYPAAPYPGRARRPGQVVGAAVLGFVQALVVLIASLYVWFFASIAELAIEESPTAAPAQAYEFAREGTVLAVVQLLSVALLVAAGILALTRRAHSSWLLLVGALVVQLGLTAYWWIQLHDLLGPAAGAEDVSGVLSVLSLFFAAAPLVGLGLVLLGSGRRWFTAPQD